MVIKGRARGGPVALAAHLERRDTNEKVSVRELRGVTSRDLRGALREMDCMGAGSISTRTLYHAAINTAPDERLTDEQKQRAIERLEQELGFEGQPRIVVEHLKKDREHMHVVFLRIDTDRMVAIPDSHTYRKHEIVARDLEREFGHERVQGAHIGRDGQERPRRTPGHDEMQQAERTGMSPREAKQRVTELWNQADSGKAFAASLAADRWVLAKGDRRDFVLVDRAGETHSLARRIDGVKAAEVRHRMSDIDAASLPSVADARVQQRNQIEASRTKDQENTKADEAVPQSITLKFQVPAASHDAAKPLAILVGQAPSAVKKPTPTPTEPQTEPLPKRQPADEAKRKPNPEPKPGPLKKLYIAATVATHRAFVKARSVFGKKTPAKPVEQKAPRRSVATAPVRSAVTPAKKESTAKRNPAQQDDRQAVQGRIIEPKTEPPRKPPVPAQNTEDRIKVRAQDTRPRLSRQELDLMISKQQQKRRERSGPNR